MMTELSVRLPARPARSYPILITSFMDGIARLLSRQSYDHVVVITDHIVKKKYGVLVDRALKKSGCQPIFLSFPAGERSKTDRTKQKIEESMLKRHVNRETVIIALGGGVVGDMAGFVAATYCRGVPYIQIPTTLLAMIDSSIGGKTAVNTPHGKNRIGLVYQPIGVLIDMHFLKTLSRKHHINGFIEMVKIFLTHDEKRFYDAISHANAILTGDSAQLLGALSQAIRIKAGVVSRDETEQGERFVLNFGHTIGHALETLSDFAMLHGYAVGFGIMVESMISHLMGLLDSESLALIIKGMATFGIRGADLRAYPISDIIHATQSDKKVKAGEARYVLLEKIGKVYIRQSEYTHRVPVRTVRRALERIMRGDDGR